MAMPDGSATERELVRLLEDDHGWAALRAGASGAATDRNRPDVLALRRRPSPAPLAKHATSDTEAAAIEVKKAPLGTPHLDGAEVAALREFARRAGATAYVVVRPDLRRHDQWHVFETAALHRTDGGNYSVRQADLPGDSLAEVFGDV